MSTTWSKQYDLPCVVPEADETAADVIERCHEIGAVRYLDGREFVVALRSDIGPELWTERALRRSLPT